MICFKRNKLNFLNPEGWRSTLLLGLLILFFFVPHITTGSLPISDNLSSDEINQFLPWLRIAKKAILQGQSPLWNPYNYCGSPLLANAQSAVFFPPNLWFYLLPEALALLIIPMTKLFLAGFFMRAFLRELGLPIHIANLGMINYTFCGYMISWLGYPNSSPFCLLPAITYFTCRLVKTGGQGWLGLSLAIGVQFFGGQPQVSVLLFLVTLPYGLFESLKRGINWGTMARLLTAYLAGTAGGAIQLIPFAEYLQWSSAYSARSLLNITWYPIDQHLITYLLPSFFGEAGGKPSWGFAGLRVLTVYIGIIPLLAAFFSYRNRRHRHTAFFFMANGVLLMVLLYRIPSFWAISALIQMTPLTSLTLHKLLAPLSFCLIILAALGLDHLLHHAERGREERLLVYLACCLIGTVMFFFCRYRLFFDVLNLWTFQLRSAVIFLGLLSASVGILVLHIRSSRRMFTSMMVGLLMILDLWHCASLLTERGQPGTAYCLESNLEPLLKERGIFRIHDRTGLMPSSVSALFELQNFSGFDAMTPRHYFEYISLIDPALKKATSGIAPINQVLRSVYERSDRCDRDSALLKAIQEKQANIGISQTTLIFDWFSKLSNHFPLRMLTYLEKTAYASHRDVRSIRNRNLYDLMNVEYVIARREFNEANFEPVSQNDFHIYRNQTRSARVAIVPRARYVDSSEEALRWISHNSFDPSQEVILIGRSTGSRSTNSLYKGPTKATLVNYQPQRVDILAESPQDTYLLLQDLYYPGWKVEVNGTPTRVWRANYLFRAIELPAGKHRIVWFFEPASYQWGKWITLLTLACLASVAAGNRFLIQKAPTRQENRLAHNGRGNGGKECKPEPPKSSCATSGWRNRS